MRKLLLFVIVIVILLVAGQMILSFFDRPSVDQVVEKQMTTLAEWHSHVDYFIQDEHKVPESMLEVCEHILERATANELFVVRNGNVVYKSEIEQYVRQPATLEKNIGYKLYVAEDDWFIVQSEPWMVSKGTYLIDKSGTIYTLAKAN